MSRRWIQILLAIVIGVFVTIVTAAVASALSSESAREVLFWPNTVLQSFAPASNIGPPHRPLYEGTPLNFVAFVASFPFSDPHGLSWPDSPIQKIASVTLEAAWLVPYSEHDLYWKIPTAAMVLMIPAFFVSVVLERCVLHFFWRSEPSTELKRFVWRANIYSYALLIVFGLIWLLYAIVDHHYRREV